MKLSKRLIICMIIEIGFLIGCLFAEGSIKIAIVSAALLSNLLGIVLVALKLEKLERAMELLPDTNKIRSLFLEEKDLAVKSYADMILQYGEELEENYSAKMIDKQTRINTLQSQINPHFLYNTLECIRSEAIFLKCDSIANMSKALSSFFRYSISRKENIVTIGDEINNIRNYFLIQSYRFDDKFELNIDIEEGDDRIYNYQIPKMTIQPIVENSIFHGLETKSEKGNVTIRIYTTEDKVIVIISDDGIGIDAANLEKMRYDMEHTPNGKEDRQSVHSNGIALYNVNQRIKLAFGNEYGINIYSTQGIGTDVEIIMPIMMDRMEWSHT